MDELETIIASSHDMKRLENNMETNAKCLVRFKDTLEGELDEHFGILFDNGSILCLCCGGYLKPGEYEIIEIFNGFAYLDQTLKEYY